MMQPSLDSLIPNPNLDRVAKVLRWVGWIGFWVQLALAIASSLMVLFVVGGRNVGQGAANVTPIPGVGTAPVSTEGLPGIGIGIFWAVWGVLALLVSIYLCYRQTRFARRLRHPNPALHPPRDQVIQVLRWGVIVGLVGLLLTILGAGATLGVLLSKSIAQPQGVAIYDPRRIIRSLDIFVAMANMNGIAAHFLGTVASLGVLNWLHRQ